MLYYVYVLRSEKNNRLYVGSTNNLARRLAEHNNGKSTYTQYTRPFKLLYKEEYLTRKEAVQREKALKSGQGRAWLKGIINRAVA